MISLFLKGGPIMWPILVVSLVTLTVVLERMFFMARQKLLRQPKVVDAMMQALKTHDIPKALSVASHSKDFVAKVLVAGLQHYGQSFSEALTRAANRELSRFNRGISILDTVVTLAPLLGLLGTVTGMIRAFGMLGDTELGSPVVITGGIAEALIATAFGLGVAILALIPFNVLNARLELARLEIQDAATQAEVLLRGKENQTS